MTGTVVRSLLLTLGLALWVATWLTYAGSVGVVRL